MPIFDSAEYVRSAIIFVTHNQNNDGGFTSITRNSLDKSPVNHSTIFYPALIGSILAMLKRKETHDIIKKINYFLQSEKSDNELWSYWAQTDTHNTQFPYPADLDDSSLAIVVQSVTKNLEIQTLIQYIQSLTNNEEKPGGPYKTWIMTKNEEKWSDIDPVVNAGIAYALKQQDVVLNNLNNYIIDRIATNNWRSPYYVSEPLMLFLLDRGLNGQCDTEIKKIVNGYSQKIDGLSLLELGLTLILMIKIGSDSIIITEYTKKIIGAGQAYAADPCILEKQENATTEISGCVALTATVCALAINYYDDYEVGRCSKSPIISSVENQLHDVIITTVAGKLNKLDHNLFTVGLQEFSTLVGTPLAREITLISFDIARAFEAELPLQLYIELGTANLWGWLSYQLYDGCYDEGTISQNLSLANICLREATLGYHAVATEYRIPTELVTDTLDHIDLAHAHELKERTHFFADSAYAKELLGSTTLNLCERSFGHTLGPQLISIISRQTKETQQQLKKLFTHYLNARQMCDDLHDWNEDYAANRLTGVTKPLFLSCYAFPALNNSGAAKEIFWEEGIVIAIRQAQQEIEQALYIMKKISWRASAPIMLSKTINRLGDALHTVMREHQTMQALIKHYN